MGAMEMSGPFWPLHLRSLAHLSSGSLAWASALAYVGPMIMAIVFTPWWGQVGDRIGHKSMLLRSLLALAATQYWIATSDSVLVILIARLMQGMLGGFIAAAQAYGAGLVDKESRGKLMAQLQVATALGSIGGPMIGGWLFEAFNFARVNEIAAIVCVACAVITVVVLPAAGETRSRGPVRQPLQAPLYTSAVTGLLFGIVLVQTGKMMPQAFFSIFAEDVLHATKLETGVCYGATAAGLCVSATFWARRFDSLPRLAVMQRVEWICWACALVVALQSLFPSLTILLATRFAWGVFLAALLPVFYGLLSREASSESQGLFLGLGNSAAKVGALVGAGAGAIAMAIIPAAYLFLSVSIVYIAAALGVRLLRRLDAIRLATP